MHITTYLLRSAHVFAGAGGDLCGFFLAGLQLTFAIEINRYRCQALRLIFPQCKARIFLILHRPPFAFENARKQKGENTSCFGFHR